jgi:hypothetical protein
LNQKLDHYNNIKQDCNIKTPETKLQKLQTCLDSIGIKSAIAILLTLTITGIFGTCSKKIWCANSLYSFETNIRAYPDYDSIKINDTIWLEYTSATQLKDTAINKIVDYSKAENLGTAISFLEMIGGNFNDPGSKAAADSFGILILIGKLLSNPLTSQVKEFRFEEIAAAYRFKIGIIPKAKGIYCFAPSDAANVYRSNDKCTKAYFRITFNNTNQHLYLYEKSRPGYTPSQYELTHMYCFKVN